MTSMVAALSTGSPTALTPSTKLIVISNAHNPSGATANRDVLEQDGVMAEAIGARVLVDEVYAEADEHFNVYGW